MKILLIDVLETQQDFTFLETEHILDFQDATTVDTHTITMYDIVIVNQRAIEHFKNLKLQPTQWIFIVLSNDMTSVLTYENTSNYVDYLYQPFTHQQWQICQKRGQRWQMLLEEAASTELQFNTLLENIPYMAWFKNTESQYIRANQHFQTHCGKTMSEIYQRGDAYVWDGQIGERCREFDLQVMNERQQIVFDEMIPGKLGYRKFHVYKAPVIDETASVIGTIGIAKDITDAINEQNKLEKVLENLPFAVCIRDREGKLINMNSKYQQHVDQPIHIGDSVYDAKFVASTLDRERIRKQDLQVLEKGEPIIYRAKVFKNGSERIFEFHKAPFFGIDKKTEGIIVILRDITKAVAQEAIMEKLAYEDTLTGVMNRSGLYQHLHTHYQKPQHAAMIFFDIDNFKRFNDQYGHSMGNLVLQTLAKRLQIAFPQALVVRDDGDKFTILTAMQTQQEIEMLQQHVETILEKLERPILKNNESYHISLRVGIVQQAMSHDQIDEIILRGETARQAAKKMGVNKICFYTPSLDAKRRLYEEFSQDFKSALSKEEVILFYQPQYTCEKTLIGFEALFRWSSDKYRYLTVLQMIELIEKGQLIHEMGEYIMRKAMQFAKRINEQHDRPLSVAINISAHQVMADNFVSMVERLLQEVGIAPELLELEITETVLLEDIEANVAKLAQLRDLGMTISLDDFGIGYSSLNYLVKLPLSKVKIDRSFIRELTTSSQYRTLVQMMIDAVHSLQLPILAEGVESAEELAFLQQSGVDAIQGYYFSKPLAESEALKIIKEESRE